MKARKDNQLYCCFCLYRKSWWLEESFHRSAEWAVWWRLWEENEKHWSSVSYYIVVDYAHTHPYRNMKYGTESKKKSAVLWVFSLLIFIWIQTQNAAGNTQTNVHWVKETNETNTFALWLQIEGINPTFYLWHVLLHREENTRGAGGFTLVKK